VSGLVDDILTPTDVARLLAVSPVTVRQWAQKGLIEARTTPGGHRRYTRAAVADFARRMAMTLPDDFVGAATSARVLVVDDDRQFNAMLVGWLKSRFPGADVVQCHDAFDAGRQVQRARPSLMLLDATMSGIDGVEVCRMLKSEPGGQFIRVIAMSAHANPELERRIVTAGAERLLKKPFGADELFQACGSSGVEAV
jgi:excisionase family DNA binding protein